MSELATNVVVDRRESLGSHDIASILQLEGAYSTPSEVYAYHVGELPELEDCDPFWWGRALEPLILQRYCEQEGIPMESLDFPGTIYHPALAYLRCTPDAMHNPAHGLDAKAVGAYSTGKKFGTPGSDKIPNQLLTQGAWMCAITGAVQWDFVCLFPYSGWEIKVYSYHSDEALEVQILQEAKDFWINHIEARVPPPADGTSRISEILAARFPEPTDEMLKPTPAITNKVDRLQGLKTSIKEMQAEVKVIGNQLKQDIGPAAGVEGLFTAKPNKNGVRSLRLLEREG